MIPNPSREPSEEDVQREAYLLYVASGCVSGHDDDNWFAAREKLASQQRAQRGNADFDPSRALHFPLNSNLSRSPFSAADTKEIRN